MDEDKREAAEAVSSDPRWVRVLNRDAGGDGGFFYAVRTTGVYCRPSCGARTPKPENVVFFATTAEAEAAGFRPCRRCRPDQPPASERRTGLVAELCRRLAAADAIPSMRELAEGADLSVHHLHRVFKAETGLTPRAYAAAQRAGRVRAGLARGGSVTRAIYAAGYNSSGRFYAEADAVLGMTPGAFRDGGEREDIRFAVGACSLGSILVAASGRGVCAISLGDDPERLVRELQDQFPKAGLIGDDPEFARLVATVVGFVENPGQGLDLPLDVRGTVFQQRVWQALRDIPSGERVSYAELARRVGAPRGARAVAGACAANVLAVAIPCHRVVRTDGGLSGYRWGVERKRALLEREKNLEARSSARPGGLCPDI